ncbi:MAG: ATPase [Christensenellales bacterium]|jgi:vacuolar-type H+-ATPase subunit H
MSVNELIEELENEIENSSSFPLTGKKMVDRDVFLEIIKDLKDTIPDEVSKARQIVAEKQRILLDAQKEADALLQDAESKLSALVDEHEVAKQAYARSQEIIANAQNTAREIRSGAQVYADEILQDLQRYLSEYNDIIANNREELGEK